MILDASLRKWILLHLQGDDQVESTWLFRAMPACALSVECSLSISVVNIFTELSSRCEIPAAVEEGVSSKTDPQPSVQEAVEAHMDSCSP